MNTKTLTFALLVSFVLVLSGGSVISLEKTPGQARSELMRSADRPIQTSEGHWIIPGGSVARVGRSTANTGGPDNFGYTWDDSVLLNWIDATNGTETGMSGESRDQAVGPITLPFSFDYYNNTYNSIYIAASGYVAFTEADYWDSQPEGVPSPGTPNNMIAPYASLFTLGGNGSANRIYYKIGGTAPNRYFVVEWFQVEGDSADNVYTFEVVLHENGDIVFQYQSMGDVYYCGISGIENIRGWEGLNYVPFCTDPPSNTAVRFSRPTPSARADTWPPYQGQFTSPGEEVVFKVPVQNTGELGTDTYDLDAAWCVEWDVSFYQADGTTALTDTNGSGVIDTGPVVQNNMITIVVKALAPTAAVVGDYCSIHVEFDSSKPNSKEDFTRLQVAVPAPFAQIFSEQGRLPDGGNGAMNVYLAQPGGQSARQVSDEQRYGYRASVVETPNGFAYFWTNFQAIEYTILDQYGDSVRPISRLVNHPAAMLAIQSDYPAVAATPDGHIGVLWRTLARRGDDFPERNENLYFAILDSVGDLVYGPVNLTNNNLWGGFADLGVPGFNDPRIAATNDNRFILAWQQRIRESSEESLNDIYYAIRGSGGAIVKNSTRFTNGTAEEFFTRPTLTALAGNRVLLTFEGDSEGSYGLLTAVLSSNGDTLKPIAYTMDSGFAYDAAELSDGRIIIAVNTYDVSSSRPVVDNAFLDGTTYEIVAGPYRLDDPASLGGMYNVSVTADNEQHAILTWTDNDFSYRAYLHYILLDSSGFLITPETIFYASTQDNPFIEFNFAGYDNTTYRWQPPAGVDGRVRLSNSLIGGQPGEAVLVNMEYANYGGATAENAILTATLGNGLTYLDDTSGITPTITGNQITWELPDLRLLDRNSFQLSLRIPVGASIGDIYVLTLNLTSAGPEETPGNNQSSAQVLAAEQIMLPVISWD